MFKENPDANGASKPMIIPSHIRKYILLGETHSDVDIIFHKSQDSNQDDQTNSPSKSETTPNKRKLIKNITNLNISVEDEENIRSIKMAPYDPAKTSSKNDSESNDKTSKSKHGQQSVPPRVLGLKELAN